MFCPSRLYWQKFSSLSWMILRIMVLSSMRPKLLTSSKLTPQKQTVTCSLFMMTEIQMAGRIIQRVTATTIMIITIVIERHRILLMMWRLRKWTRSLARRES